MQRLTTPRALYSIFSGFFFFCLIFVDPAVIGRATLAAGDTWKKKNGKKISLARQLYKYKCAMFTTRTHPHVVAVVVVDHRAAASLQSAKVANAQGSLEISSARRAIRRAHERARP